MFQVLFGFLLLRNHVELILVHLLVSAPGRGCWWMVLVISSVLYSAGPSLTVSYPPCSTLTQTQSLFAGRGQTQLIGGPRQPWLHRFPKLGSEHITTYHLQNCPPTPQEKLQVKTAEEPRSWFNHLGNTLTTTPNPAPSSTYFGCSLAISGRTLGRLSTSLVSYKDQYATLSLR